MEKNIFLYYFNKLKLNTYDWHAYLCLKEVSYTFYAHFVEVYFILFG